MFNSLKTFDKSSLKKTTTKITTETGDQFVEFKNDQGFTERRKVNENGDFKGFVVDLFADIQVGEILPGLILGTSSMNIHCTLEISLFSKTLINYSSVNLCICCMTWHLTKMNVQESLFKIVFLFFFVTYLHVLDKL